MSCETVVPVETFILFSFNYSGASNLNELYNLLKMHVMIRRLKKEVIVCAAAIILT